MTSAVSIINLGSASSGKHAGVPEPGTLKTVQNGKTMIELTGHGAIANVADAQSGHRYFEAKPSLARLFHLIVPTSTWASRAATAHEADQPVILEKSDETIYRYEHLNINGQLARIKVEVSFKRPRGTDEILISMNVVNDEKTAITGAIFPWLNGWKSPGNPALDKVILGPGCAPIDPASLSSAWRIAWANNFQEEASAEYPVSTHLPWMDFSGEHGGVSCINYQREPRHGYASVKNMTGFTPETCIPGMFWGFYAYVPSGQAWASPSIGISVHDGDWHQTADRYRRWAEKWLAPASSNRKFRESIGSLHVYFTGFDGTPFKPAGDLAKIASAARGYGVKEFCVWDRLSLGVYGTAYEPEEDVLKYSAAEKAAFSKGIRQAVQEGSDVSALINFRLMNPKRTVFKTDKLEAEMQETLDGTTKAEAWPVALIPGKFFPTSHLGPGCQVFSPFSEKYRQRVLRLMDEYLDFGYTSLFYDQPFEYFPDYSRKATGGVPELTYEALLQMIRDVQARLKKQNPDAVIMGEQCDIFASAMIDQWMTWAWSDHPSGIEILRQIHYALPQTVFNCVISVDSGSPSAALGLASHSFALGLHLFIVIDALTGTLAEVPEFGEHVLKLARLRKLCADRTVHARFCDNRGFSIKTNDGIAAYSYESPAGPALIIAAPIQAGSAEIQLHRNYFSHAGNGNCGKIYTLDLEEKQVPGDIQFLTLKKNDVLVWMP